MQASITIGQVEVRPGQRITIDLPMARLYTHTEMAMPVQVIHGKKEGPRLFISAAIHGDEINGTEIIRRLLRLKVIQKLRGTLITIPVVNVFGFINRSRYLPDRRDLNRSFPGTEKGSLTSRLARLFMDEIATKCTHGIDLHTGSNHRFNLPQVRADLDTPETEAMAMAFGAPVIIDARLRDGSLRAAVHENGIPIIIYEGGEALRFNEMVIRTGIRGIISTMRHIGLLPQSSPAKKTYEPIIAHSTSWTRAPRSGILQKSIPVGSRVVKNDQMGVIVDPYGESEERIISASDGVVVGRLNLPLVHRGDAIFNVASVHDLSDSEGALDQFDFSEIGGRVDFDEEKL